MKAALTCVALLAGGAFIAHNMTVPAPAATSLPQGMQCDIASSQTGFPADVKDYVSNTITYKFVNGYWTTVPQKDTVLRPVRVTDDAYLLAEASDETKTLAKGIVMHMVSSPMAIGRKTGDVTFNATTTSPNDPKIFMKVVVTGHCLPVAFNN